MAIGVFDSGLGGLTVVKELKKNFPKTKIIYLGDTARVPYGTRSAKTVQQFAVEDAKFLEDRGVSHIIIACNTASALAYEQVKAVVSVPVYEVITPAKNAAEKIGKNIGVIGTRGTITSGAYGHNGVACPLLVPFIEEGDVNSPALRMVLGGYLDKLGDIDTLILGCTHYPFIADLIQGMLPDVKLVNPGQELAKILDLPEAPGEDEYYVTDLTKTFLSQGIGLSLVEL
jgi:glutamate racemase